MKFESINFFEIEEKINVENEIREVLDGLSDYLKEQVSVLDFYPETILLNETESEEDLAVIDYYASAPHLRNYRVNLFSISYKYLGEYPAFIIRKYDSTLSLIDEANGPSKLCSKEEIYQAIFELVKESNFRRILIELSQKTL